MLHINRKDILKVLKQFNRILKKGGKLHLRVKKGKGIAKVKEKLSRQQERIFTFYEEDEIKKLLLKANFHIISIGLFKYDLDRKNVKWVGAWAEK